MKLPSVLAPLIPGLMLPLMIAQSCAPTVMDDDTPSLTTDEANAVQAAVSSSAALAQAITTSQNGAPIGNDDTQARTGTADDDRDVAAPDAHVDVAQGVEVPERFAQPVDDDVIRASRGGPAVVRGPASRLAVVARIGGHSRNISGGAAAR